VQWGAVSRKEDRSYFPQRILISSHCIVAVGQPEVGASVHHLINHEMILTAACNPKKLSSIEYRRPTDRVLIFTFEVCPFPLTV